ncbi:hypothetical protein LINPERHAP2_LOCUS16143, partial [Linum perenne]
MSASELAAPRGPPHRTSWTVEIIDEANNRRMKNMVVADAWANLRDGEKTVLSWAAGIPSDHTIGFLGQFIGKPKFYIGERDLPAVRRYMFMDMGKKWREGRGDLIHEKYDKKKSLEWNQVNPPDGIEVTDWVMFLAYRNCKEVKEMAAKTKANRAKQGLLHHLGLKKINRLKSEMEEELQREVSRGKVLTSTSNNYGRGACSANQTVNPNVMSRVDFDKMAGMFLSIFNQIPRLVIPPELAAFAP